MISGINTGTQMNMPSNESRTEQTLTQDQQKLISDTLTEFDPDNLSESDALSIVESLSDAGIQPGKALESALSDLGFDAKSIGDLAGVSGPENGDRPPPPPPAAQSSEEVSDLIDYLTELLEEKLAESSAESLSEEDKDSIYAQVSEKFGFENDSSMINLKV